MLSRRTQLERSAPLNSRGPRTRDWERVRRQLKVEFERRGITFCELRLPGCMFDNGLGFAHTMKRRNIRTLDELRAVALLCNNCHNIAELQGEAKMKRLLESVINGRAA